MQVSTTLFYDRAASAMGGLNARTDTLQAQIATHKRLAAPSDDAAAYARLRTLAHDGANADAHAANLDLASSLLSQGDSTLGAMNTQLQRASELAIQARSGSGDPTSRAGIADELDSIRDQLISLANATDARGQPLFGGADGSQAVTIRPDGSFSFASTQRSAIPVDGGQSVQPGESAARIFQAGGSNMLTTLTQLSAALRAGTAVDAAAATAIGQLGDASTQVVTVQASLGARASRVELEQGALKQAGIDREATRSGIEDTDITSAITELQKTMTILSATQASFTKLQGLSLFNYLK